MFFIFTPIWGRFPFLTSIFFRWVGSTTNQLKSWSFSIWWFLFSSSHSVSGSWFLSGFSPGWFFNADTIDVAQGLSMSHVFYSDKGRWINDHFGHVCWDTCGDFKFLVELWFILVMRTCLKSNTYLTKWSNLTSIFQIGCNHQLVLFLQILYILGIKESVIWRQRIDEVSLSQRVKQTKLWGPHPPCMFLKMTFNLLGQVNFGLF